MDILITGVHGFVGTNLVASLNEGHSLYGLDITVPSKGAIIKTYGWNELGQIPLVDCIIHLAGKAHDTKNTSSEKEYFDVNYGLTKKIFDLFLKSKAKKFIYFSSVKAIADSVEGVLVEDILQSPHTAYGRSKLAAEKYILKQILPKDKSIYILRPCMIHGPDNKGNLNLLYKIVKKGIPWPLGKFENKRSFTSIDNLNFIIKNIIEKDIPSGVYNIADDEPISTNHLIKLMGLGVDKKTRILNVPKKLIILLAKIGDKLNLTLNSERLKKLTESYVVSNEKLKGALNIKKMPVKAEEGIIKTIKSFNK